MSRKASAADPKASAPAPAPKSAKVQLSASKINDKIRKGKADQLAKIDEQKERERKRAKRHMLVSADGPAETTGEAETLVDGFSSATAKAKIPKKVQKHDKPAHKARKSKATDEAAETDAKPLREIDLLRDNETVWFELLEQLPVLPTTDGAASFVPSDDAAILEKKRAALALYEEKAKQFDKIQEKVNRSDEHWLRTVLQSGTSSDKMAAMMMLLQQGSVFRKKIMEQLMSLAAKKGRRESIIAIDTIKDLFLENFIPSNRKLVPFHRRPLIHPEVTENHLIIWFFEDFLKEMYSDYVKLIEHMSHDSLLHPKKKAQQVAYQLLADISEQEQYLLQLLINKMGDRENKVSSNSVYLLLLLLDKHPAMKLSVVKEVEAFLHRPNVTDRAMYYAVILLNQIVLGRTEVALSQQLLAIYFNMFKRLLAQAKASMDSRMLSALLTGVNRAFPFAPQNTKQFDDHINTLYKLVHVASFNKAVQALLLIFQVQFAQKSVSDRFYRALYEKLLAADLAVSSKQGLFLNVLFKALKFDQNNTRVAAILKRLLQVALYQKPGFACGALFLTSELFRARPQLRSALIDQGESVADEDLALSARALDQIERSTALHGQSTDTAIPAADLTGAHKSDKKKPVLVFDGKKRHTSADFTAADLKHTAHPDSDDVHLPLNFDKAEYDDQEADGEVSVKTEVKSEGSFAQQKRRAQVLAWLNRKGPLDLKEVEVTSYDPKARDPQFAAADITSVWELNALMAHFHPSVSNWASQLLSGKVIQYAGDPLKDMSLHNFLDRFMYKNPKAQVKLREAAPSQVEQTMTSRYSSNQFPVNSPQFLNKSINQIPEHEVFFYTYFKEKRKRQPEEDTRDKTDDDAIDSFEADNMDEAEIETAVLEALEQKENKEIFDRKAQAKEPEEYDYDDLGDEDFEDSEESIDDEAFNRALLEEDDELAGQFGGGDDNDADDASDDLDFLNDNDNDDDGPAQTFSGEESDEDVPAAKGMKKDKKKGNQFKSSFASLDSFAHLLETSGVDEENAKERAWDEGRLKNKSARGFKRKQPDHGKKGGGKPKRGAPPAKRRKR